MSTLFRFFDAINREDFQFVDNMTDEEVKEISPYVLLGWMHGAIENTGIHTILTDISCNRYVFSLSKHPRLLLKLFIESNGGIDSTRYKFQKSNAPNRKVPKDVEAVSVYYGVSHKDASGYVPLLSKEELDHIMKSVEEMKE